MLQWNPVEPNRQVIYNTLVDGAYGSAVFDLDRSEVIRQYAHPIYSVDSGFRYAATLSFSRLGRLRPGYGYALLPDETAGVAAPENDGLFLLDLASGDCKLVVNLAELSLEVQQSHGEHYVNHATFSPDGKKLVFFHLWAHEGDKSRRLRVLCYDVESSTRTVLEDERTISHYCWRDADVFLATNRDLSGNWRYSLYDTSAFRRQDLTLPLPQDGHPMFHPRDKTLIVTDTYPDRRRDQHLLIANIETNEITEIATLYSPAKYRGQARCDLHPRWDREGRTVVVDSTIRGRRRLMVISTREFAPT